MLPQNLLPLRPLMLPQNLLSLRQPMPPHRNYCPSDNQCHHFPPSTETTAPHTTNVTTAAPHTTNVTTAAPHTTNVTTAAPHTTNVTTAAPPTPTTPPPPEVGDYIVRAGPNSSACLMAKMGLQLSYRMGASFQTTNLNPNGTMTTGTCGDASNDSTLVLVSDKIAVQFIFTNLTSKFFLSALSLTVVTGSGPNFTAANTNLSLWEASLGSSYMCKKEQSFNITDDFILNTFELQVQPFGVTNDQFSTAHECSVDDTSLLIPIIVGAALAVLILIVVIAYVIVDECFLDTDLSFVVPIAVGMALGFLIILVLLSYLVGLRKSRTGYQSV
ncbi:Lysosome-associated membrane glycoprotein 2 [Bagarius yarrelli]|uniref:Lysosome-associated membrane glycoprotein 2 n=1 Tax=Bagarius yarrelli TaxID=175774 RepID=A0A556V0G8_BAGYA|nr:Lysosome-associated membrane glycoprotein 2 [Bagarius yarrelli]